MTPKQYSEIKKAYKDGLRELAGLNLTEKTGWHATQVMCNKYVQAHPKCEKCGNENNLSYDHIIPVSILNDFNIEAKRDYWEENGQTLCRACNVIKGDHLDFSNPKTKPLLMILISNS